MPVEGLVAVAVLDDNGVAVATTTSGEQYLAITGSLDWRAPWCGVVDTLMGADLVQDRVLAAGREARTDAGEINRGADESLAHAVAVGGVIIGIALLVGVANGAVGLAAIGKAGREDIAVANHFVAHDLLFVDHVELITLANILGEVDVVAKNPCHVHGQAVRQACALAGGRQRALDHAVGVG
ncbi:hypothetical protein D3C78_1101860 [compost metagenome]